MKKLIFTLIIFCLLFGQTFQDRTDRIKMNRGSYDFKYSANIGDTLFAGDSNFVWIEDTYPTWEKPVTKLHRIDSINVANTNWNNIAWDTIVESETTAGYDTLDGGDTIIVDFSGIVRVQGCLHLQNNKGNQIDAKAAVRTMVNTIEARCLQTSTNVTKDDGENFTLEFEGTIAVSKNDLIYVQYKMADTDLDLEGDTVFDNPVASSVNFERISR